MSKDRENYRSNLEMIRAEFPGKAVLSIQEVSGYLRRDRRTLLKDKAFPAQLLGGKYAITVTALARYIS